MESKFVALDVDDTLYHINRIIVATDSIISLVRDKEGIWRINLTNDISYNLKDGWTSLDICKLLNA